MKRWQTSTDDTPGLGLTQEYYFEVNWSFNTQIVIAIKTKFSFHVCVFENKYMAKYLK